MAELSDMTAEELLDEHVRRVRNIMRGAHTESNSTKAELLRRLQEGERLREQLNYLAGCFGAELAAMIRGTDPILKAHAEAVLKTLEARAQEGESDEQGPADRPRG